MSHGNGWVMVLPQTYPPNTSVHISFVLVKTESYSCPLLSLEDSLEPFKDPPTGTKHSTEFQLSIQRNERT